MKPYRIKVYRNVLVVGRIGFGVHVWGARADRYSQYPVAVRSTIESAMKFIAQEEARKTYHEQRKRKRPVEDKNDTFPGTDQP